MCGRYTSITTAAELGRFFAVDEVVAEELGRRYNVAPTDDVYAVAVASGRTVLGSMRWGMVPPWSARAGSGRMINARAESVLHKPAFRSAFARRRCLVPADGFYEWQPTPGGGARQPWYIRHRRGEPLAFAGIWESWSPHHGGDRAERVVSCAIITAAANQEVAPVHHRMPVALAPSQWAAWLDPDHGDVAGLLTMLVSGADGLFHRDPVLPLVNTVGNEGPALIEPADVPGAH